MPPEANRPAHTFPLQAAPAAPTSLLDELMTATQVAQRLQMRVSTVEDYAKRGLLPSLKLGRHRRFVRSQIEQAIANLATAPAPRRPPRQLHPRPLQPQPTKTYPRSTR